MSPRRLLYLDQNYISRIVKHTLGQRGHDDFGRLYRALQRSAWRAPASPFHAHESAEHHLLADLQALLEELSGGGWLLSWEAILERQRATRRVELGDILTDTPRWSYRVDLEGLAPLIGLELEGHINRRIRAARAAVWSHLGLEEGEAPPFADLLARLIAMRANNSARRLKSSDLVDILMAASYAPYGIPIATDRFVRESLKTLGYREGIFDGKRESVRALEALVGGAT